MKRVFIIGARDSGEKNSPAVMQEALSGHAVIMAEVLYWEDLLLDTAGLGVYYKSEPLDPADIAVLLNWYRNGKQSLYRDVALAFGLVLERQGTTLWNSEVVAQRSSTKLSCMSQLALAGVTVPRTLFALDPRALYDAAIDRLAFPLVVKAAAASRGRGNYLVHTSDQLRALLSKQVINRYIVQPFVANDHDLRIICFGGTPALALRRSRKGNDTHLNNTSQGGTAEWMDLAMLPPAMIPICERICCIMKREIAGIDFIPDSTAPGGYACLEVNSIPQLTSGVGVDKKLSKLAEVIALTSKGGVK